MESINKYKNCKIEDMQLIFGGRETELSYSQTTGEKIDKSVYNRDGCLVKYILWMDGHRYVGTYAGDCENGYNESMPIDGNVID